MYQSQEIHQISIGPVSHDRYKIKRHNHLACAPTGCLTVPTTAQNSKCLHLSELNMSHWVFVPNI